jgi:hypothetical protein
MSGSAEGMMRVFLTEDGKKSVKFYNFGSFGDRKVHLESFRLSTCFVIFVGYILKYICFFPCQACSV